MKVLSRVGITSATLTLPKKFISDFYLKDLDFFEGFSFTLTWEGGKPTMVFYPVLNTLLRPLKTFSFILDFDFPENWDTKKMLVRNTKTNEEIAFADYIRSIFPKYMENNINKTYKSKLVETFKKVADEYHKKVETFANSYQNKLKSDLKSGKIEFVFGEGNASSVDNDPNRDSLYYYVDTNNPER